MGHTPELRLTADPMRHTRSAFDPRLSPASHRERPTVSRGPLADSIRMSGKHFTLVADGHATAASFAEASALVAERVMARTGVQLTAEPDLVGQLPRYAALTAF